MFVGFSLSRSKLQEHLHHVGFIFKCRKKQYFKYAFFSPPRTASPVSILEKQTYLLPLGIIVGQEPQPACIFFLLKFIYKSMTLVFVSCSFLQSLIIVVSLRFLVFQYSNERKI